MKETVATLVRDAISLAELPIVSGSFGHGSNYDYELQWGVTRTEGLLERLREEFNS